MNKVENGHDLAYLIWDTNSLEELNHLRDVFDSCMKIRREQFVVIDEIMRKDGLSAEFVRLDDLKVGKP